MTSFFKATSLLAVLAVLIYVDIVPCHSYEERPEEVEVMLDIHRSVDMDIDSMRKYLRPGFEKEILPEALLTRVVCYTDGTGYVHASTVTAEFWHKLNSDGRYELSDKLITVGILTCEKEEEARYGPKYPYDESSPTWPL